MMKMENKYQEALDRLLNDDYDFPHDFYEDDKATAMERDIDTLQELVDKATPKNPILVTHGKVKMTAKEMFDELGFEYKKYNRGFAYEYDDGNKIKFIHFIIDRQTYCTNIYHVSTQLHNAITAQMKELEWI